MITENSKVRLVTGEIAHIDEILEQDKMYVGVVYGKNGKPSVSHIANVDISTVFVETEHPYTPARQTA